MRTINTWVSPPNCSLRCAAGDRELAASAITYKCPELETDMARSEASMLMSVRRRSVSFNVGLQ